MERYKNRSGRSGVAQFEIGADFIRVHFKDGQPYLFTYQSAGKQNVEHMKELARAGQGLNSYINATPAVKYGFER